MTRWWIALALVACSRPPAAARAGCPHGHRTDPKRSERVLSLLARDPEAAALVRRSGPQVSFCYAPRAARVIAGDALLLDEYADDRGVASRAAHLLHHRAHGVARSSGHAADGAEREARALEERLRREL